MATHLPSCFSIQFFEQLLKFLVNFTLLKYVKSQRSYGFLITKELIFGFQILDLKDPVLNLLKRHLERILGFYMKAYYTATYETSFTHGKTAVKKFEVIIEITLIDN